MDVLVPNAQNIRGVGPDLWFSPLQPIAPVAPTGTAVRVWDYPLGANIEWTPRSEVGAFDFNVLRAMADSCYLFRVVLQALKDKLSAVPWEIRPKPEFGETRSSLSARRAKDPRIKKLTEFFNYPDGFHSWAEWIRIWLEELMVLDAAPILLQREKVGGEVGGLICLAGHTINRLLDSQGMTPKPPDVAYQQVLYGLPAVNMTTDDLTYVMRNERAWRRYGFSPVEHIVVALAIAIKRQDFQLKYYTSGTVPEALVFLPSDLTTQKVEEVQNWFDANMSGNSARRRRLTFLPGMSTADKDAKPNIVFPKEPLLKDEMDEWLARIIAYDLGMTPQQLVRMMNRATAHESSDVAEEEGMGPIITTVDETMTKILNRYLDAPDLEFVHAVKPERDPLKQSQILAAFVSNMIMKPNEAREELGLDADPSPEANMLGVKTGTGFVPIGIEASPTNGNADAEDKGKGSDNNGKNPLAAAKIEKLWKATRFSNAGAEQARRQLSETLRRAFKKQNATVQRLGAELFPEKKSVKKADQSAASISKQIYDAAEAQTQELIDELAAILEGAAVQGVVHGVTKIGAIDQALIQKGNAQANAYARMRAAELVGMRLKADGTIVQNPSAKYRITKELRDKIRAAVAKALESETPLETLRDTINASGIFSVARADMIARTEVQMAQIRGSMAVWKESGVVEKLEWTVGLDPCDECEGNDGEQVSFGEAFPSGDDSPPAHPQCMCDVAPIISEDISAAAAAAEEET